MKTVFLTLFLLLFFFPVFGHDIGEHQLYEWETKSGIKWKTFGDEKFHRKYKGEIKDGKPNGVGILIEKGTNQYVYIGEWLNGMFHGKGKELLSKDTTYEGDFKKGKFDGIGNFQMWNGDYYEGEWREGRRNGRGFGQLEYYSFNGDWKNNQFVSGKVIWSKSNESKRKLKIDNQIILEQQDEYDKHCRKEENKSLCLLSQYKPSYVYEGEFKNMKEHGRGVFRDYYSNKFVGEFKHGGLWNIKQYDITGKLRNEWINGKKIK